MRAHHIISLFAAIFLSANVHAQKNLSSRDTESLYQIAANADDMKSQQLNQMNEHDFLAYEWSRCAAFFDPTKEDFPFYHTINNPHQVRVINDGLDDLELRLRMIERAKKSIDYMTFQFNKDVSGQMVLKALLMQAQKGVKVRLLLDHFNQKQNGIDEKVVQLIQNYLAENSSEISKNFEIHYYNPKFSLLHLTKASYRNHAKMLIVDGSELLLGGRNTGDEFFEMRSDAPNVIDRDLWAKSENSDPEQNVALEADQAFDAYWTDPFWTKTAMPDSKAKGKLFSYTNDELQAFRNHLDSVTASSSVPTFTVDRLTFVIDRPDHTKTSRRVTPAIDWRLAQGSQYFIAEQWIMPMSPRKHNIFNYISHHRNVPIIFLTNGVSSSGSGLLTEFSEKTELQMLKNIPSFWSFDISGHQPLGHNQLPGHPLNKLFITHAKSFVLYNKDSSALTFIGSYNFDERSEFINNEAGIIIENSPAVASFVTQDIRERIEGAHQTKIDKRGHLAYVDGTPLHMPHHFWIDTFSPIFYLKKILRAEL